MAADRPTILHGPEQTRGRGNKKDNVASGKAACNIIFLFLEGGGFATARMILPCSLSNVRKVMGKPRVLR